MSTPNQRGPQYRIDDSRPAQVRLPRRTLVKGVPDTSFQAERARLPWCHAGRLLRVASGCQARKKKKFRLTIRRRGRIVRYSMSEASYDVRTTLAAPTSTTRRAGSVATAVNLPASMGGTMLGRSRLHFAPDHLRASSPRDLRRRAHRRLQVAGAFFTACAKGTPPISPDSQSTSNRAASSAIPPRGRADIRRAHGLRASLAAVKQTGSRLNGHRRAAYTKE